MDERDSSWSVYIDDSYQAESSGGKQSRSANASPCGRARVQKKNSFVQLDSETRAARYFWRRENGSSKATWNVLGMMARNFRSVG